MIVSCAYSASVFSANERNLCTKRKKSRIVWNPKINEDLIAIPGLSKTK